MRSMPFSGIPSSSMSATSRLSSETVLTESVSELRAVASGAMSNWMSMTTTRADRGLGGIGWVRAADGFVWLSVGEACNARRGVRLRMLRTRKKRSVNRCMIDRGCAQYACDWCIMCVIFPYILSYRCYACVIDTRCLYVWGAVWGASIMCVSLGLDQFTTVSFHTWFQGQTRCNKQTSKHQLCVRLSFTSIINRYLHKQGWRVLFVFSDNVLHQFLSVSLHLWLPNRWWCNKQIDNQQLCVWCVFKWQIDRQWAKNGVERRRCVQRPRRILKRQQSRVHVQYYYRA